MRALIPIALLATSCVATQPKVTSTPPFAEFAQATPQKDTLYLIQSEPGSQVIKRVWDLQPVQPKPQIIFVDSSEMATIKKRLSYDKKN
jgi:hypothetical protein